MDEVKKYLSDNEAKTLICEMGRRAYEKGFVCGSDGNISIKVGDNSIWATPTGVSKGFMSEDWLVKLDLDGNILEMGALKPSSEIKMHLRVYKENADVQAVVHAHPPIGTAYAIAGISLDEALMAEGVVYLGAVPCAKYGTPGTQEVPDSIAPFCKDYNACFLGNHGTLTWADTPIDAYYRLESLEQACKIHMLLHGVIKQINPLTEENVKVLYDIRKKSNFKRGGIMRILNV